MRLLRKGKEEPIRLLALDPASHYTGYAYFEGLKGDYMYLHQFGIVRPDDQKDAWDLRCLSLQAKIRGILIVKLQCTNLIMEFPQVMQSKQGKRAMESGDTFIHAYICGCIATGWQLHMGEVMKKQKIMLPMATIVTPAQWKGQLPKPVTGQRCMKKYGVGIEKKIDDNVTDAIMIGDHWIQAVEMKGERADGARRVDL